MALRETSVRGSLDLARLGAALCQAARDVVRWLQRPGAEQDCELERERAHARKPVRARQPSITKYY